MVISSNSAQDLKLRHRESGSLMTELVVAMSILLFGLIPLSYSVFSEKRLARATYQRSIAMELVDGELEVLAAGPWRDFTPGTNSYSVQANASVNLPTGEFRLIINSNRIELEWVPAEKNQGGSVRREVMVK